MLQQAPASHVTPVSLTATPTLESLIPVSHDSHGLQPEASALKLTAAEPAADVASERSAPESKLERSSTVFGEHPFLGRYPAVPSSVHSFQYQRPAFPLDPSIPAVPDNSFSLASQNAAAPYASTGISRSDHISSLPGRQPPQTDSISPLIPPKPGSFLRTPPNQFIGPNRAGGPQAGMYGRVPQSKISVPWNSYGQPGRGPPLQNQMIGPVVGPRNPPHSLSPSQPHVKNPFPAKFHFMNPYSLSEQQPQHSQLVPSVVAPPDVPMSHSPSASTHSNAMITESHVAHPSKIYALTSNGKVDVPQANTSPISAAASTLFPDVHYSDKNHEKHSKSPSPVEASTILESVMNAVAASSANEVNEVNLHA